MKHSCCKAHSAHTFCARVTAAAIGGSGCQSSGSAKRRATKSAHRPSRPNSGGGRGGSTTSWLALLGGGGGCVEASVSSGY